MGVIEIILIFIAVILLLVVPHELGHMFAAKAFGIKVEEFGVGFFKRLWSIKIGETIYSINILPLGGFVRIFGEDEDRHDPRSFSGRSFSVRSLVVAAGIIANIFVGYLMLSGIAWYGLPKMEVVIEEVTIGTPAELAGFRAGDRIVGFDGIRPESIGVGDVHAYIDANRGKQAEFMVMRDDAELRVLAGPRATPPEGQGPLGIRINNNQIGTIRTSIFKAPIRGAVMTKDMLVKIVRGAAIYFASLFSSAEAPGEVFGPVGIAFVAKEFFQIGIREFLTLIAFLSLNLAVINILPIPALDGGRIAFFVVEKIIRRPIPARVAGYIHSFFFLVLIGFLLWVTWYDIARLL